MRHTCTRNVRTATKDATVVVLRFAALAGGPVAVISGGSGHEPTHAGCVGEGMLVAAVAGNVFTSPSVDDVLAWLRVVGGRGAS